MTRKTFTLITLLPLALMMVAHVTEARGFSSRSSWGASKSFKRPVTAQPKPLDSTPNNPTPAQPSSATSNNTPVGQRAIPGAERYRNLSQQAPSATLKRAINTKASTGARLTQLAMLYWLISSSNTHASELSASDRAWVQNEIKEKEKNGEKLEDNAKTPAPAKP